METVLKILIEIIDDLEIKIKILNNQIEELQKELDTTKEQIK